jgi:PAS domain S-box-containing protein
MDLRRARPRRPRRDHPLVVQRGVSFALLDHLSDGVIASDADGTTLTFNRKAREIFGAPHERTTAAECAEHYSLYEPGEDRLVALEDLPLYRALHGEQVRDRVVEVRRRRRAPRLVNVSGDAVVRRRRLLGAVLVMQDITERVAKEQALRLQSAIAEHMADGVVLMRAADGEIVYANETAGRMFEYAPGELIGQPVSILDVPSPGAPLDRAGEIVGALERDGVWSDDIEHRRKRGGRLWCHVRLSPFEHPVHGTVWISVHTDITARRRDESALQDTADRFRAYFEQSPVGILIIDHDLRVVDANRTVCEITGYRRDELVGSSVAAITHPEDMERVTDVAQQILDGALARYQGEKRCVTKQGDVVRVSHVATAIRDVRGRPVHGVTIIHPVDEGD